MAIVYVKRLSDGAILDMPEEQGQELERRGGFKVLPPVVINSRPIPLDTPEVKVEDLNNFLCPLCDRGFDTERGLKRHKATHV